MNKLVDSGSGFSFPASYVAALTSSFLFIFLISTSVFAVPGAHPQALRTPMNPPPANLNPPITPVCNHIEVANGALNLDFYDLRVPGTFPNFEVRRMYISQQLNDGFFGFGWNSIFNSKIEVTNDLGGPMFFAAKTSEHKADEPPLLLARAEVPRDGATDVPMRLAARVAPWIGYGQVGTITYTVTLPNGFKRTFSQEGRRVVGIAAIYPVGEPKPAPGVIDRLSNVTGEWVLQPYGQRLSYHFDATTNLLTRITSLEGNELRINRDEAGNPTSAVDPAGRTYAITTSGGHITTIADETGRTYTYAYSNGNLVSVSHPENLTYTYAYDTSHHMTEIRFPNGGVRKYVYSDNRVSKRVDEEGNVQTYLYSSNGNRNTFIDERGGRWQSAYNGEGNLLWKVNPLGETTVYGSNANRQVAVMTDPSGSTWGSQHDQQGNKIRDIFPDGRENRYTYDGLGFVTSVTNAAGEKTTYTLDGFKRVTAIQYPDSAVESIGYDSKGREISRALPGRPAEMATYDQYGMPDLVTDPNGNVTDLDFNARGNLLLVTDPIGRVTRNSYDALGRLTSRINADNSIEAWTYSCCGLTSYTDGAGKAWSMARDYLNRVTSLTDPAGRTSSIGYDSNGNTVSVTKPSGAVTALGYDSMNQLVSVNLPQVGANPSVFRYERDSMSRIVRMVDPTGRSTVQTYDSVGRLVVRKYADGSIDSFAYDAADRIVALRDGLGRIVSRGYTPRGFLAWIEDARGARVELRYDSSGLLVQLTDPRNNATDWEYTNAGDVQAEIDPLGNRIEYTYDDARQLTRRVDARGIATDYRYDSAGRVVNRFYSGRSETYVYDAVGRMTFSRWGADTNFERYTFDATGRALSHHQAWIGDTVTYTYDSDGRMASRTGPFGETVVYTRDAQGRLSSLPSFAGNFGWSFDAAGRPTQMTRPNGVTTDYSYEAMGRLKRIQHGSLRDIGYTYDSAGQIVQQTEETSTITYSYDAAGQLTDADYPGLDLAWTYDSAGNRATEVRNGNTTSYTVNAANELTQVGSATVKYDSAGNMISRNNGTETFTWDEENRLTKYESGTVVVSIQYANDWRAIARVAGTSTEYFAYDGDDFSGRRTATETVRYVYSGEVIDQVLAEVSGAGALYYLADMPGSVRGMTDGTGALALSADYEAWGALRYGAPPYLGFTGRPQIADEMTWFRWRQFSPSLGRFSQSDPIGHLGGENLHRYVFNNPLIYIDRYGLYVEVVFWQGVGMGRSSLGHVSVNINGTSYSFSPSAWYYGLGGRGTMNTEPTVDYDRRNNFRSGTGYCLNLNNQQEQQLQNFLANFSPLYDPTGGRYAANCTDPIERGLAALGINVGNSMTPAGLRTNLRGTGLVNQVTTHNPGARRP